MFGADLMDDIESMKLKKYFLSGLIWRRVSSCSWKGQMSYAKMHKDCSISSETIQDKFNKLMRTKQKE